MAITKSKIITEVIFLASMVVVVVFIMKPWEKDGSTGSGEPAAEVVFDNVGAFLQSDQWKRSEHRQVVCIGLDGASWDYIDPLIEQGKLPNFARLKREGAYGSLRSTECYMTPPAWITMFTGRIPAKTGVYTFGNWDSEVQGFVNVNSLDVEVPAVWDVASNAGRRVGVVNVPVTYPPHAVNGIMVGGMMTPNEAGPPMEIGPKVSPYQDLVPFDTSIKSYTKVVRDAAGDALNTFLWTLYDTNNDGRRDYNRLSIMPVPDDGGRTPLNRLQSYTIGMGEFSPWIKSRFPAENGARDAWVRLGMNTQGQAFTTASFSRVDVTYTYPAELAQELEEQFGYYMPTKFMGKELVTYAAKDACDQALYLYDSDDWDLYTYVCTQSDNVHHLVGFAPLALDVYRHIDRLLGDIMDRLPSGGTLLVTSDHGFGNYTYGIDLNQFFGDAGLLRWKDEDQIDYENTLVFHNLWHLYFNDKLVTRDELGKRGIEVADREDPWEALCRYLAGLGAGLKSGDGRALPVKFDPVPRDAAGSPPDMIVQGSYDDYLVVFWNFKAPQETAVRVLSGSDEWFHHRRGIYAAWGDVVRDGYDAGVTDIQDIAATMLYLLDLPIARDMDGRLITGIIEPSELARKGPYQVGDYADVSVERIPEVDREALEKKLRSLGYLQN